MVELLQNQNNALEPLIEESKKRISKDYLNKTEINEDNINLFLCSSPSGIEYGIRIIVSNNYSVKPTVKYQEHSFESSLSIKRGITELEPIISIMETAESIYDLLEKDSFNKEKISRIHEFPSIINGYNSCRALSRFKKEQGEYKGELVSYDYFSRKVNDSLINIIEKTIKIPNSKISVSDNDVDINLISSLLSNLSGMPLRNTERSRIIEILSSLNSGITTEIINNYHDNTGDYKKRENYNILILDSILEADDLEPAFLKLIDDLKVDHINYLFKTLKEQGRVPPSFNKKDLNERIEKLVSEGFINELSSLKHHLDYWVISYEMPESKSKFYEEGIKKLIERGSLQGLRGLFTIMDLESIEKPIEKTCYLEGLKNLMTSDKSAFFFFSKEYEDNKKTDDPEIIIKLLKENDVDITFSELEDYIKDIKLYCIEKQ